MGALRNLILALVILTIASGASANLIINGSFEQSSSYQNTIYKFRTFSAGSEAIDGWTATGGIDYIGNYWQASDGVRSLDLSGAISGGITQTIDTIPGRDYTVDFDMAGNPMGGPTIKDLQVSVGGSTGIFSFDVTGSTQDNMMWTTKTWSFRAIDKKSDIVFESLTEGAFGPALDNVNVSLVHTPAPSALLLSSIGVIAVGYFRRKTN